MDPQKLYTAEINQRPAPPLITDHARWSMILQNRPQKRTTMKVAESHDLSKVCCLYTLTEGDSATDASHCIPQMPAAANDYCSSKYYEWCCDKLGVTRDHRLA
jgi:hypothetical protein